MPKPHEEDLPSLTPADEEAAHVRDEDVVAGGTRWKRLASDDARALWDAGTWSDEVAADVLDA